MRRTYWILLVLIVLTVLIFSCDHYFKTALSDPLLVGKQFCFAWMCGQHDTMKEWADNPSLSILIESTPAVPRDSISLLYDLLFNEMRFESLKRLDQHLIIVYSFDYPYRSPDRLFYGVVLAESFTETYWIRFRDFLHSIPLLGGLFGDPPLAPTTYTVVNFYSEDNLPELELARKTRMRGGTAGESLKELYSSEIFGSLTENVDFWTSNFWSNSYLNYLKEWSDSALLTSYSHTKGRYKSLEYFEKLKAKEFLHRAKLQDDRMNKR